MWSPWTVAGTLWSPRLPIGKRPKILRQSATVSAISADRHLWVPHILNKDRGFRSIRGRLVGRGSIPLFSCALAGGLSAQVRPSIS